MNQSRLIPITTMDSSITKEMKIKHEEIKEVEYIFHPITKKYMKSDSPSIRSLIEKGIISNKGLLLVTQDELDEATTLHVAKKHIAANRFYDGVDAYMPRMRLLEVYHLMKRCEEELKSDKRGEDFKKLTREADTMMKEVEIIKKMRNTSLSSSSSSRTEDQQHSQQPLKQTQQLQQQQQRYVPPVLPQGQSSNSQSQNVSRNNTPAGSPLNNTREL